MELRIERGSVLEQTVAVLRQAIMHGRFKPGERLVEADLCAMLSVSRTSLREALRRLEAERLVDIIPNRGPMVPIVPWEDALQIYEARKLLEGEAAALAARKAGAEDRAGLAAALAEFCTAVKDDDAAGQIVSTKRFYDVILRCGGNHIIRDLLEGLHARISFLRGKSMSQPGRGDVAFREMEAIASAIAEGNDAKARTAAMEHVERASHAAREAYARLSLPATR